MDVLVGYASEHGSTREIAERIAGRLTERGCRVEVRSMDQIAGVDGYDAVVLGSAVHQQAWLPQARQFVQHNTSALAARPVWLFSVGMPGALPRWLRGFARKEEATILAGFRDTVRPRDHRLFSGVFQADHVPFAGRLIFKAMGGRYGDYRSWAEIDAWSESIAHTLAVESGRRPGAEV